jgi:hypothetical protein
LVHDGHHPRPLQLNATSRDVSQSSHATSTKPYRTSPHRWYGVCLPPDALTLRAGPALSSASSLGPRPPARHSTLRPVSCFVLHFRPESVRAQTRACAALAEGAARDGGASAQLLKALDDCRRRIEKLDAAYHDSMEPPVDDLSQRLEARLDAGARP